MKKFSIVEKGYNQKEVNEFLDIVINRLEKVVAENNKLNANSIIHEALVNAEKTEYQANCLRKNITVYKNRVKSILESQIEIAEDLDKIEI